MEEHNINLKKKGGNSMLEEPDSVEIETFKKVQELMRRYEDHLFQDDVEFFSSLKKSILGADVELVRIPEEIINILEFDKHLQVTSAGFSDGQLTGMTVHDDAVYFEVLAQRLEGRELVCVSDTHGDWISSAIAVRKSSFFYAPHKMMLINLGDFSGRGDAVFKNNFFWLALKSLFPESVVLLRGNHEYDIPPDGLTSEDDLELFYHRSVITRILANIFRNLPLAYVATDQQLVALHGAFGVKPWEIKKATFADLFRSPRQIVWSEFSNSDDVDGAIILYRTGGEVDPDIMFLGPSSLDIIHQRMGIKRCCAGHVHVNHLENISGITIAHVVTHSLVPLCTLNIEADLPATIAYQQIGYLCMSREGELSNEFITFKEAMRCADAMKIIADKPYLPFCELLGAVNDDPKSIEKFIDSATSGEMIEYQGHDVFHRTALHYAILAGDPDPWLCNNSYAYTLVQMLLRQHLNLLELPTKLGLTPLHYACLFSYDVMLITYLLEQGANICTKDIIDETPLHALMKNEFFDSYESFLKVFSLLFRFGVLFQEQNRHQENFLDIMLWHHCFFWQLLNDLWSDRGLDIVGGNQTALGFCRDSLLVNRKQGLPFFLYVARAIQYLRDEKDFAAATQLLMSFARQRVELGEVKAQFFAELNESVTYLGRQAVRTAMCAITTVSKLEIAVGHMQRRYQVAAVLPQVGHVLEEGEEENEKGRRSPRSPCVMSFDG